MNWRQQQALELARQREELRAANAAKRQQREFNERCARQQQFVQGLESAPVVGVGPTTHRCPPYCHRCPDMRGEVLPMCTAVALALDWEDLSVCACHAGKCTCGHPSHESICQCEHIPLLIRQIGLVASADRANERARQAESELARLRNMAERIARAAIADLRTTNGHIQEWWALLRAIGCGGPPLPEPPPSPTKRGKGDPRRKERRLRAVDTVSKLKAAA